MIPPSPPQSESPDQSPDEKNSESATSGVSNIRFHVTVEEGDDDDNEVDMHPSSISDM